jgi:hypothetical protein
MRPFFLALVLCCSLPHLMAQGEGLSLSAMEDSMMWHAARMQESPEPAERTAASRALRDFLDQALRLPGSWDYPFDKTLPLSVQADPEGTFRLFSWQLSAEPGHFRHFGFLQTASAPSEPIALTSRNAWLRPPQDVALGASDWIGQIYYKVHPFRIKGKKYWVLFGFSSADGRNTRKIADILHFDRDDKPVFGAPLFHYPKQDEKGVDSGYRIILDYAAESQVSLNFDAGLDLILFDHLIPFADDRSNQGMRFIPDGSYSGFRLKRDGWHYISKLEQQSVDEAPVPFPVLNDRKGRDIMGRERK